MMIVSKHTAADGATAALREMILAGQLKPGERVHQDHLAELLGLSRTPLRTALATLTTDGLLDYEANCGYRVREFSLDTIRSVFEIRSVLEAQACRIAARLGCSDDMLDKLDALLKRGDDILASGELKPAALPDWRRMNVDFHETIIHAANNPLLGEFVGRTHNVPMVSDRVILWDDFYIIQRSHDDHHRITRALRHREGERAAAIMNEHVSFAGDLLIDRLGTDPEAAVQHLIGAAGVSKFKMKKAK
jgi:GntR family transcriptional regulator, vanillate catabolism transcriptional regulator